MTCSKQEYESRAEAKNALRRIQRMGRSRRGHKEQRVYQCDRCRLFHLTKDPSDEQHVERFERARESQRQRHAPIELSE